MVRRSRNFIFCSEEKCDMLTVRTSSLEGRREAEGKFFVLFLNKKTKVF